MALLDDAIDASGGMARWNSLSRFTLHLSVAGTLFSSTGHASEFKDVTAEGSTRTQSVRFTGITGGEHSGSFQPDAITIESLEGEILRTWPNPSLAFTETGLPALADELHLVFFCGVAIWNYLTNPFLLAHPDVVVEELPPWQENNESWRRLRAQFAVIESNQGRKGRESSKRSSAFNALIKTSCATSSASAALPKNR